MAGQASEMAKSVTCLLIVDRHQFLSGSRKARDSD
jgi:hypothetical protein